MELFCAGGPLQCDILEERESSEGLTDLALSSLDTELLSTFQGYLDHSIISIIDDNGPQTENKGHYDEGSELSLLTALTEILDNGDDENMSPFDTLPDSELLASPKDRDGGSFQKLLSLSRTPPDREVCSLDDHRRLTFGKIDRCSGPNWDLFPDAMNSTPRRRTRHRSIRACLSRKPRIEPTQPRSDGEEEEVHVLEKISEQSSISKAFDDNYSMDVDDEMSELDNERLVQQGTPCIINTENVALNDLVKYMHPYCLPAITVCLEPEDEEGLLGDAVFLEIVSDQGETVKVPVIVEQPGDTSDYQTSEDIPILDTLDESDVKSHELDAPQSTSEQCVPELDTSEIIDVENDSDDFLQQSENTKDVKILESMPELEKVSAKDDNILESMPELEKVSAKDDNILERMPELEKMSSEPLVAEGTVDKIPNEAKMEVEDSNGKELDSDPKKTNELERQISDKKAPEKTKKSTKEKRSKRSKLKAKRKNKEAVENEPQVEQAAVSVQSTIQSVTIQPCHPSLQESDLLIKTLDQVKRESQNDLRLSKLARNKVKSRLALDNQEKKVVRETIKKEEKPIAVENEQAGFTADVNVDLGAEKNAETSGDLNHPVEACDPPLDDKGDGQDKVSTASAVTSEETANEEEGESATLIKEAKPKSLSLSEYRKRLQSRKPNPEKESGNSSCSKWPSLPELPTELAELPCLIVPASTKKTLVDVKPSLSQPEGSPAKDAPVTSDPSPPAVSVAPVNVQEAPPRMAADKTYSAALDSNLPPPVLMPTHPNIAPPFFPPVWPTVPSHPPYYPGIPSLPAVPQFPNTLPPVMPIQPPPPVMPIQPPPPVMPIQPPPPVMAWPPFPPPPIPVGPVPPNGWVSGLPPPFWSNPQMPQGMPEVAPPFSVASQHIPPEQTTPPPGASRPSLDCNRQVKPTPVQKPDISQDLKICKAASTPPRDKPPCENLTVPSQAAPLTCAEVQKSSLTSTAVKSEASVSLESKVPDVKSANQLVNKIVEILKKAQKFGFQIKPPVLSAVQKLGAPEVPRSSEVVLLKAIEREKDKISGVPQDATSVAKPPSLLIEPSKPEGRRAIAAEKVQDKPLRPPMVHEPPPQTPALVPVEQLCKPEDASSPSVACGLKEQPETFACDSGIEASDLTSLLEEFEKSEAKDEDSVPPSPDRLAVGNSGPEKPLEKKIAPESRHLAPELVNTAGLTPPATPPHRLWKSVSGTLNGKAKANHGTGQEKPCSSPLKSAKLIDAKPLPHVRVRGRSAGPAPSVAAPPIHVASGEHDYCILSASCTEKGPPAAIGGDLQKPPASQKEEGSRWNVKHHPHIVIKPIVPFNKRPPKQATPSAPSMASSQSCPPAVPAHQPLDHRTNPPAEPVMRHLPDSVLMSPDSSPCRSEHGESRTDVSRESAAVSRRSLRCYRKYRDSASPQTSAWRGASSGSRSSSSSASSSSSRSRSRSPPSKRRRTYRSRGRHRSRSSSQSSYDSSSSSRSFSCSSGSRSPSSSRSRSRSRSPYSRKRYRSRSRRCESREAYYRQRMYHKERAIEERRVVYIGKINSQMTRTELRRRFSVFGDIEECTIHFREEGDNYGFVTYRYTGEAFAAIENGHKLRLPDELPFDLCFGGRRQFCKSNYADLDSNRDDFDPAPVRSKFESVDFDTLLREAQKKQRR